MEVACVLGKVKLDDRGVVAAFQDMGWLELGSKVECPSQGHASLPLLGNLCSPPLPPHHGTAAASGGPAHCTPGPARSYPRPLISSLNLETRLDQVHRGPPVGVPAVGRGAARPPTSPRHVTLRGREAGSKQRWRRWARRNTSSVNYTCMEARLRVI